MSDLNIGKSGFMLSNKPDYPREPSWPYFIWIVFLTILFGTIILWALSIVFHAPLEEEAAWAKTPNPAKAPWYFIGLQELLVYFDPWIAGVLLPGQILIGLILIPYVDVSPHAQGRYGWKDRKFAVSFFSFGLFLWFLMIVVGQWFRGPSWEFYWPYFDYPIGGYTWTYPGEPLKVSAATLVNMSNAMGWALIMGTFVVGMVAPVMYARSGGKSALVATCKDYYEKLGLIKYLIVQSHVMLMILVVGKIVVRLVFDIKYVVATQWFNI